ALTLSGQFRAGLMAIREGFTLNRATGVRLHLLGAYCFLAEAQAQVGLMDEGLETLDEARVFMDETGERQWAAEMDRIRAELLQLRGDDAAAEASLHQAIEVAQRQRTKSWELRAVITLSRLWQRQGKTDAARRRLSEVYDWFTEGFETADLVEARALLDELSH
ncbi:MAG: hypothetical protein ACP5JG_07720, partial [Anaerolineae bacterium]